MHKVYLINTSSFNCSWKFRGYNMHCYWLSSWSVWSIKQIMMSRYASFLYCIKRNTKGPVGVHKTDAKTWTSSGSLLKYFWVIPCSHPRICIRHVRTCVHIILHMTLILLFAQYFEDKSKSYWKWVGRLTDQVKSLHALYSYFMRVWFLNGTM